MQMPHAPETTLEPHDTTTRPNSTSVDTGTTKAEFELWERFRSEPQNTDLRNAMVERYAYYVEKVANKFHSTHTSQPQEDWVSAGWFGLLDAINAYDHTRGMTFEKYSYSRIYGAMLDECRRNDVITQNQRQFANKVQNATILFQNTRGHRPNGYELAEFMELDPVQLESRLSNSRLQQGIRFGGGRSDCTTPAGDSVPTCHAVVPESIARLCNLVPLSTRDRLMVLLYYVDGLTMREIGDSLNVKECSVSFNLKDFRNKCRAYLPEIVQSSPHFLELAEND